MSINDIIAERTVRVAERPPGLRHDAHVAFKTAYEMLLQLGQINDRRKSFIYVSSGYTFDPFRDGRYARIQQRYQEVQDTPTRVLRRAGQRHQPADQLGLRRRHAAGRPELHAEDRVPRVGPDQRARTDHARGAPAQRRLLCARSSRPDGDDSDRCARPADLQRLARLRHDAEQLAADAVGGDRRVLRSARRTTTRRACSGSTPRRATTTSSATRRPIRIRSRSGATSRSR